MAKAKTETSPEYVLGIYKDYLLQNGDLPHKINDLAKFSNRSYEEIRKHFSTIEAIEIAVIVAYFTKSTALLTADEKFETFSNKEKHLAFLYTLIEKVSADEIFVQDMLRWKKNDLKFMSKLANAIMNIELNWTQGESWGSDTLNRFGINPKKSASINHAIACIYFWMKDESTEKTDTDAFIEKSSDVLFRIGDTSTLESIFDFGKFVFSRKSNFKMN